MITRSSCKRDSKVKPLPTNDTAYMTPKTSLSSKIQKRRSTTGRKQTKENNSNFEGVHSPVFNIQIHLPCMSGNNETSPLPVVQPVIHLHLDSLSRNIENHVTTEENEISGSKSLRNSVSPIFKVNYCKDYDKTNESNEKSSLKRCSRGKKINNSSDFESTSPKKLRRSCSLSSSDGVVEKKKVKGKKAECCNKINCSCNTFSSVSYNKEKFKLKDLRVQLNDIRNVALNSCENKNKNGVNNKKESLHSKKSEDVKESSPKFEEKLNETFSDVSASTEILTTEKQKSFSEDDKSDIGDESDGQEEEGGNGNRRDDIAVSSDNEKSLIGMRSSGIYSSVYMSNGDDDVLHVNGDITSLVEGCNFSEILKKLRSTEFKEKIISSGDVMSTNGTVNSLSNGEKQLTNAEAGPSTGDDSCVEVMVIGTEKEKTSDYFTKEKRSQEKEDSSCTRMDDFVEEKEKEDDGEGKDIESNTSSNHKVQESYTESGCAEDEIDCRTNSDSINCDEVDSSPETDEKTETITENNKSCELSKSLLTEENLTKNENEIEDTSIKEVNGSQCVCPNTETDCFQQLGENEESSEQDFSSNESNKDSRFESEEEKVDFILCSESLGTTSENELELEKVRINDLTEISPTSLQLKCIEKEMRRRGLTDLLSKKKKKKNKHKEKSRLNEKERTKSNLNDSSQSFSSAEKVKLEPVSSGKPKNFKKKHAEDYIPLNVSGPTKFSVGMLEKINPSHDAVNLKKQLLFGNRVKRFRNPLHLNICRLKRKAGGKL